MSAWEHTSAFHFSSSFLSAFCLLSAPYCFLHFSFLSGIMTSSVIEAALAVLLAMEYGHFVCFISASEYDWAMSQTPLLHSTGKHCNPCSIVVTRAVNIVSWGLALKSLHADSMWIQIRRNDKNQHSKNIKNKRHVFEYTETIFPFWYSMLHWHRHYANTQGDAVGVIR